MILRLIRRQSFDGPNLLLPCRAVALWLSPADAPPAPPGRAFLDTLTGLLLDSIRPRRSIDLGSAFREVFVPDRPLRPEQAVAVLTLELQRLFAEEVEIWTAHPPTDRHGGVAIVACEDHALALSAAVAGVEALAIAAQGRVPDPLPDAITRFLVWAEAHQPDSMMRPLLSGARRLGIPVERMDERGRFGRHAVLGHGRHARMISGTMTDRTSAVAMGIAASKRQANRLLGRLGFPVPDQALVQDSNEALAAARNIGFPLVVKPDTGTSGLGITAGVASEAELEAAVERAKALHPVVLVERFIEGEDHRLLVAGGRLVAATQRRRPGVTGDGRRSVAALVEELNADPRRGRSGVSDLVQVAFTDAVLAMLARQGLSPEAVPEAGRHVLLASTANIKAGGLPVDVTGLVHPDNRRLAEEIARSMHLDFVGVDFLTPDIGRSHLDVTCGVIEINASPGIGMYGALEGESERVASAILSTLFGEQPRAGMPLVAVLSDGARTGGALAGAIGRGLSRGDMPAAWYDGDVVAFGHDEVHRRGVGSAGRAAPMVLGHPRAAAGVLACTNADVASRGFPWPSCDVAVILADAQHAQAIVMARTARQAVVATPTAPWWPSLAAAIPSERLIAVGPAAAAAEGRAARRAVLWRLDGERLRLKLREGDRGRPLRVVADPGRDGARQQVAVVLAAALGLGVGDRSVPAPA